MSDQNVTPRAQDTGSAHATRWPAQEEVFVFCGLMLLTCLFLPWQAERTEVTPWNMLASADSSWTAGSWILFVLLDACAVAFVNRLPLRPWFGIATAMMVCLCLILYSQAQPGAYGARLAKIFAFGLLVCSAGPAIAMAGDFAMRRLNSRRAEVFTHWGTVLPGLHFSSQEFYARLEAEIRERNWPGVEFLRVLHTEAGLLSHQREYLRVIRQRQVLDVGAGTFGRDYFFTLREAEMRPQITLPTLLILVLSLVFLLNLFIENSGYFAGLVNFSLFLGAGVFLLWNALPMGLTRLDGLLMRMPLVGPVYESWFRVGNTYFQHDTRMVFLKLMDDLVKERVDEETSAKGVRHLSCFEHQPLLDGLYKTSTRVPKDIRGE